MSSGDGFHIEGLDQWKQWLQRQEQGGVERMKDRILRTAGLRTLEYLHDLTPVRTSRLANSMTMGGRDNVFEVKAGQDSYVFVGTAVEYAQYVNDGFSQESRRGKFVPGYWQSGHFHYDPNAETGMILTGKIIPGARMFEKALDYLEDDMPDIMEFEFRRLYAELIG